MKAVRHSLCRTTSLNVDSPVDCMMFEIHFFEAASPGLLDSLRTLSDLELLSLLRVQLGH